MMAAKFDIGNLIYKTTDDTNIKLWKKTQMSMSDNLFALLSSHGHIFR